MEKTQQQYDSDKMIGFTDVAWGLKIEQSNGVTVI